MTLESCFFLVIVHSECFQMLTYGYKYILCSCQTMGILFLQSIFTYFLNKTTWNCQTDASSVWQPTEILHQHSILNYFVQLSHTQKNKMRMLVVTVQRNVKQFEKHIEYAYAKRNQQKVLLLKVCYSEAKNFFYI